MDTYQGDLYEPVTLHKYLYANANPVKYSDPSGMTSLSEINVVNAISKDSERHWKWRHDSNVRWLIK